MSELYSSIDAYCLGYTHEKCDVCQKSENWHAINQLPDALRLSIQRNSLRINADKCRLTNMGNFEPIKDVL